MELSTQYSLWLLPLCIALGAFFSWILYKQINFDLSNRWKYILTAFRFFLLSILSFLLLEPVLKQWLNQSEKPILLVAHDNSESVVLNKDSGIIKNEYALQLKAMLKELEDKYEIHFQTIGEKNTDNGKLDYSEKQSNLSAVFSEAGLNYSNRNLSAIVLATDGLYNLGNNPELMEFNQPVYTIGLGDTTIRKDISVLRVNNNRLAYKGNQFPVEVLLKSTQCKSLVSKVSILLNGKICASQNVIFNKEAEVKALNFILTAETTGVNRYTVKVEKIKNEFSEKNNTQDFYIEVIEGKEKILILSSAPHPDINALKQSIEENENLSCDVVLSSDLKKSLKDYNLIILHQIPANNSSDKNLLIQIKELSIPVLFIIGSQTNFNVLSEQSSLVISGNRGQTNEATPMMDEGFNLFGLSDNTQKTISKFPPLTSPYANYKFKIESQIFLNQQIGSIKTTQPLFSFVTNNNNKQAFVFGEGLWRWKLTDYLINENQNAFNEIINKTIQFLSVKIDRSRFKVKAPNQFFENEEIILNAEYYNESYELKNEFDAQIILKNEEGKDQKFVFSKENNAYRLNAGQVQPGNYSYVAELKSGNKTFTDRGKFTVKALQLEGQDLAANHYLLKRISKKSEGKFYLPQNLQQLKSDLQKSPTAKPLIYSQRNFIDLINWEILFFILITLVSAEWFIRKYFGGY